MRYGAAGGEVEISFSGYTNSSDGRTKRDGGRSRAWMKPSPGLTEAAIKLEMIVRLYYCSSAVGRRGASIYLRRGELELTVPLIVWSRAGEIA